MILILALIRLVLVVVVVVVVVVHIDVPACAEFKRFITSYISQFRTRYS